MTSLILCVHAAWLLDLKGTAKELGLVCDDEIVFAIFRRLLFGEITPRESSHWHTDAVFAGGIEVQGLKSIG